MPEPTGVTASIESKVVDKGGDLLSDTYKDYGLIGIITFGLLVALILSLLIKFRWGPNRKAAKEKKAKRTKTTNPNGKKKDVDEVQRATALATMVEAVSNLEDDINEIKEKLKELEQHIKENATNCKDCQTDTLPIMAAAMEVVSQSLKDFKENINTTVSKLEERLWTMHGGG